MKGMEQKARKALENAVVEVGNTAKNFFVENFRKQGFDDKTVEKWEARKKKERKGRGSKKSAAELGTVRSVKAGRAILVKTGDLRRSIIRVPNRAALNVKIQTDLIYAKVHNDGLRAGRGKGFKMPKRQFIGDSYNLNEKVKAVIVKRLDKVFT